MILQAIKYTRLEGEPKEWTIIGCDNNLVRFRNINLVVGKNAAGKTRMLSAIKDIAGLYSGILKLSDIAYENIKYQLVFKDDSDIYEYYLEVNNRQIKDETLSVNGQLKLNRSANKIYSETSKTLESFNADNDQLSTLLHNPLNHSYIEKLHVWGKTLRIGKFTNQFEKNYLLKNISQLEEIEDVTSTKPIDLLHSFWLGKQMYGNKFVEKVKSDMSALQYPIETIDISQGAAGCGIYVKEDELDAMTGQMEMSQGMFRALAFIIRMNLASIGNLSVCILVDDLGEGLDFDRSQLLIDLLIKNTYNSNIQIFTTTNDRYIMNRIPLEYWSVIERFPHKSVFYNYYNSKNIFDDFKYTGLNNFDFLATDFYIKGFGEADE